MIDIGKELRIMHACERGATGVYRGHKCVARYFFRTNLNQLDGMRNHEIEHAMIFEQLLADKKVRKCFGSSMFFWGGLFYGVFIGLFGLRAIGASTSTIENIVNKEIELSLLKLESEQSISDELKRIQQEELEHKRCGDELAGANESDLNYIKRIANFFAYTAKYLAQKL